MRLAGCWLLVVALASGCDHAEPRPAPQAAAPAPSAPSSQSPAAAASGDTAEHSCDDAHPPRAPVQVATATALSKDARQKLTTLRVMAHVGAVIIRKENGEWVISGPQGCKVAASRVERALDNLAALRSEPTAERPQAGSDFELQVVALMGEERALHFDMAGRVGGKDLVQLADYSTYWVSGFDRGLWAANPRAWCAKP
jgi:hypothetical protein